MSAEKRFPAGWEVKRLGEVCEICTGKKDVNQGNPNGQYPFFTCAAKHTYSDVFSFDDEAIFIAGNGNVGQLNYYSGKFEAYQRTYVLTGFKSILAKYLYSVLDAKLIDTVSKQKLGNTMPYIKMGMLTDFTVPLPPLSEQKRIVAILDEAFQAIDRAKENAEKNLANAREVFDGYLNQVFSNPGKDWEEKKLGEIAQHSLGKMLDKAKNKGEFKSYLRNLNVRWFSFDLSDLIQMRFTNEETDKYTVQKGDVLVCEGGYPGRSAIWDDESPMYFQKAIHRVRFINPILNKWFVYHLYISEKNGSLKDYVSGAGIQHFTGESLDRYVLPIAPDKQIISAISKMDLLQAETRRLESIYQKKLAALDELKKVILQKAFSGEL